MKLKDSNKLSLISGKGIYIKGLEVSGVKERTGENKNSTISIQSQTLNISGLKAIDIQCYNLIEQPWKKDTERSGFLIIMEVLECLIITLISIIWLPKVSSR